MSRSDYLIIAVVGLCLAALIFLVYQFSQLNKAREASPERDRLFQQDDNLALAQNDSADYEEYYPALDSIVGEEIPEEVPAEPAPKPKVPTKTTPAPAPAAAPAQEYGDYLVLAGAFRQQINAEEMLRQVRRKGYSNAEIAPFNRGAFAAVVVDRFPTDAEAEVLATELRNKGIDAYVQKKRQ